MLRQSRTSGHQLGLVALTLAVGAASPAFGLTPNDIGEGVRLAPPGTQIGGQSMAYGDLDGDGDIDIITAEVSQNLPSTVALRGVDGLYVSHPVATDLDGDGTDDLVVARGVDVGDLDGDGDLDAVFVHHEFNQGTTRAEIWWNDGAANLSLGPVLVASVNNGDEPQTPVLIRDLNGDGCNDVLVAANQKVHRFMSSCAPPNSTLALAEEMDLLPGNFWDNARSLALADLTGDGVDDLFVTAWVTGGFVVAGDGQGGFTLPATRYTTPPGTFGRWEDANLADIDGDGDIDVYIESNEPTLVWLNDGGGGLTYAGQVTDGVNPSLGSQGVAGDFDNDGDADFVTRYGHIWQSNGDATFTYIGQTQREEGGPLAGRPNNVVDLDGDGKAEIVMGNRYLSTNAPADNGGGGNGGDPDPPAPDVPGTVDYLAPHYNNGRLYFNFNDGQENWSQDPVPFVATTEYNVGTRDARRGDFDGDGWEDVLLLDTQRNPILCFNAGENHVDNTDLFDCIQDTGFDDTQGNPMTDIGTLNNALNITAADLNGDGRLDIVAGEVLCINDGDRTFTCGGYHTAQACRDTVCRPQATGAGDFDGDGELDLFVLSSRYYAWTMESCMGLGDTDADGLPNYACASTGAGSGLTNLQMQDVVPGDFNHDGILDIIVRRNSYGWSCVGGGDGTFMCSEVLHPRWGFGGFVDWDNDGDQEWFNTQNQNGNPFLCEWDANAQDWTCAVISGISNWTSTFRPDFRDIDGDGRMEAAGRSQTQGGRVFRALGYDTDGVTPLLEHIDGNLWASDTPLLINLDERLPTGGGGGPDGDGDGVADDSDNCPDDANADQADADDDGVGDVCDDCPSDGGKTEPGICGCGVADDDSDQDGTENCDDDCPLDGTKLSPGICGCGVDDDDTDQDGTADCNDGCPVDGDKTAAGICGCGVADDDSDNDGTADCLDLCPNDGSKTEAGICGCGVADDDSDDDGTADCNDGCPADADKTDAGICGCGVSDDDTDQDGTEDCNDSCPDDAGKTEAGVCGCGVSDDDSDDDGTADCNDGCPADGAKTEEGICGCGTADTDSDDDGTADCNDDCPADAGKTEAGVCGCGTADTDTDGDNTADCVDGCPADADKVDPGVCGCGTADTDTDDDGDANCIDDDDDDDGVDDGFDADPLDATVCRDDDADSCDDCSSGTYNPDSDGADLDVDGLCDAGDACPADADNDADGDDLCGDIDACPFDADNDIDGDGACGDVDNCVDVPNDDQEDLDGDGDGNACDDDDDGDGVVDAADNCPLTSNPDQLDSDDDAAGDACDEDDDDDGFADAEDNCPATWNPSQQDLDDNGVGDLCEVVICEVIHRACQKERRADDRECDLDARMCKRGCDRRDRRCQNDCKDVERACHDDSRDTESTCKDTPCQTFGFCRRSVHADDRTCSQDAREERRDCRRMCTNGGLGRDCRKDCRQMWRENRSYCRDHRRYSMDNICRAPRDAVHDCRDERDEQEAEARGERNACRADCDDRSCRQACDDEFNLAMIETLDDHGTCLEEAADDGHQ